MLIGELVKKSGLSRDTIRFYERAGLIHAGEKEAGSRIYKTFDEATLERLIFIKDGQTIGFTLREIKEVLDRWGTDLEAPPLQSRIAKVQLKIEQTEEKIRSLEVIRQHLVEKLERLQAA